MKEQTPITPKRVPAGPRSEAIDEFILILEHLYERALYADKHDPEVKLLKGAPTAHRYVEKNLRSLLKAMQHCVMFGCFSINTTNHFLDRRREKLKKWQEAIDNAETEKEKKFLRKLEKEYNDVILEGDKRAADYNMKFEREKMKLIKKGCDIGKINDLLDMIKKGNNDES